MKSILLIIIVIKILGMLYRILTTRMMGIEGMRLISMIMPALSLYLAISSLSIQSVCNQNIASNMINKTTRVSVIMLSSLRITLVSSCIISIIMLLSFPLYNILYNESFIYYPLLICIPLIFLSNISGVMKGYLEANSSFKTTYTSNLLESLAKILIAFSLLLIFKEADIYIKAIIIFTSLALSELCSCIYLALKIKKICKISIRDIKTNKYELKILKQAIPLTTSMLFQSIINYLVPFVFYYAVSKHNISMYYSTTYYALITSFAIPLLLNGEFAMQTIAKLIFPNVTKRINDKDALYNLLDLAIFVALAISIICSASCYYHSELLLKFLYKNTDSANIVHFLSPFYIFIYFIPIFIAILQSYQNENKILVSSLISGFIEIILIYFLCSNPIVSLKGFYIAICCAQLIKFILLMIFTYRSTKYIPKSKIAIPNIIFAITYFILAALNNSFIYYSLLTLIYALVVGLFFYHLHKSRVHYSL